MKMPHSFKWVLISFLAAFTFGANAQNNNMQMLSAIEQKILKDIETNMPATIQLLKESVNINSGTYNIEGVKKVGAMYAKELAALDFTIEWINLPDSLKRAGHLVAYRKGKKSKKVFLIGHLDTVFEPDMPANPFTMLNDSTATGQGVNDMKGGDVLVIAALKVMHQQGLLDDTSITVYFTGDEENIGNPQEVSRSDFIERAKKHDIALCFETNFGINLASTSRRGSSSWELTTKGKQGHSAAIFRKDRGYGAIYEAARILNEFREVLSQEKYLTFNPGLISGGTDVTYNAANAQAKALGKNNIVAQKVIVSGDLRFLTELQRETARDKMKAIVAKNLNQTSAEITFRDGIPAMEPTEANAQLLSILDKLNQDMGLGSVQALDPNLNGAGDISYIAKYIASLDGLGASGKGAHAPGETINLKEYPLLIQRAALFIYRLTR